MKGRQRRRIHRNPRRQFVAMGRTGPVRRERLLLPGIQLALAGRLVGTGRVTGLGGRTEREAGIGLCWAILTGRERGRERDRAAIEFFGGAATAVAVPTPWPGDKLCNKRRTRHHQPDWFLESCHHRRISLILFLRGPAGDGSLAKNPQRTAVTCQACLPAASPSSWPLGPY